MEGIIVFHLLHIFTPKSNLWCPCCFEHMATKRVHYYNKFKVVLEGYHGYFFGVKVKREKGEDFTPAQIIQMMAFTRIMAIWTPAITL